MLRFTVLVCMAFVVLPGVEIEELQPGNYSRCTVSHSLTILDSISYALFIVPDAKAYTLNKVEIKPGTTRQVSITQEEAVRLYKMHIAMINGLKLTGNNRDSLANFYSVDVSQGGFTQKRTGIFQKSPPRVHVRFNGKGQAPSRVVATWGRKRTGGQTEWDRHLPFQKPGA